MAKELTKEEWAEVYARLQKALKFKIAPIGIKWLEDETELERYSRLKRANGKHFQGCQFMGQAARQGQTVGFTVNDLVQYGLQCHCILGLAEPDRAFYEADEFVGVWFENKEAAMGRQKNLNLLPNQYKAVVAAPIERGKISDPDVVVLYLNPAQTIYFVNGYQWKKYERIVIDIVGESTCCDSWTKAMLTKKLSISIPCFAERRFGGVADDEMIVAAPIEDVLRALEGMEGLSRTAGLRYPIPPYNVISDPSDGLKGNYEKPAKAKQN